MTGATETILAVARAASPAGPMGAAALIAGDEVLGCVEAPCGDGRSADPWGAMPREAIRECLAAARRDAEDVRRVVVCGGLRLDPPYSARPARLVLPALLRRGLAAADPALAGVPLSARGALESLAAAAFHGSPFPTAALLLFCGEDERAAVHLLDARPVGLRAVQRLAAPHSPARLLDVFGHALGLRPGRFAHDLAYLGAYGAPRHSQALLAACVDLRPDGSFALKGALGRADLSAAAAAAALRRRPLLPLPGAGQFDAFSADMARSVIAVLRYLLGHLAIHARRRAGAAALCLGGGFAWELARHRLLPEDELFRQTWVHPQGGAGALALGAALAEWGAARGADASRAAVPLPYLGAQHSDLSVEGFLSEMRIPYDAIPAEGVPGRAADLVRHKQRVGWFRDREESGGVPAGHRQRLGMVERAALDALADPRQAGRLPDPVTLAVLADHADRYFEPETVPPFRSAPVGGAWLCYWRGPEGAPAPAPGAPRPPVRGRGPVMALRVTAQRHPALYRLLDVLRERTGVPLLRADPLADAQGRAARSPAAAYGLLRAGQLDALVLGSSLVLRVDGLPELPTRPARPAARWLHGVGSALRGAREALSNALGERRLQAPALRKLLAASRRAAALAGRLGDWARRARAPSWARLAERAVRRLALPLTLAAALRNPPQTFWRAPTGMALNAEPPMALPAPMPTPSPRSETSTNAQSDPQAERRDA